MVVAAQLIGQISIQGGSVARAELSSFGAAVEGTSSSLKGLATGALVLGGAALVGFAAQSVKMAGDFQSSMTRLVTSAGELPKNLKMISDGIIQMSVATGTSTEQLAKGMYYVESAGNHGAAALDVLRVAAMGAKTENANLDTVSKALTTTMTDYHMPVTQSANAMNGLIATVQNGKTNLQELASSMGKVLPIASALHISFPQVAGALDTMTNAGMSSQQAAQNLAHVLVSLQAPTKVTTDAMQQVGLSAEGVKDALVNKGLPQALQLIEEHVGQKFPKDSIDYQKSLKDILGGLVGFKVAAMLTGDSLKQTEDNVNKVTAAMKAGGGAVLGWSDIQQNFNFKLDQAKMAFQALEIGVGTLLLPVLGRLLDAITPILSGFAAWASSGHAVNDVIAFFHDNAGAIIPVLAGLGAVIASVLVPAVWSLAAGVIAATWPFLAIGAAVAGVTALFMHFYQTNAPFRDFVNGIGKALGDLWTLIQANFLPVMTNLGTFMKTTFLPVLQLIGSFLLATFKPVWDQLVVTFKTQLVPIWDSLVKAIQPILPQLKQFGEFLLILAGGAIVGFMGILGGLLGALAGALKGIITIFAGIVETISGAIKIVSGVISFFVDLLTGHFNKLGSDLGTIMDGIGTMFHGAWTIIEGIFQTAFGAIIGAVTGWARGILTALSLIPGPFGDMAKKALDAMNGMTTGSSNAATAMKDKVTLQALTMKANVLEETARTQMGAVANFDKMRLALIAQIQNTSDPVQKKILEMRLSVVTNTEQMHLDAAHHATAMSQDVVAQAKKMADQSAAHAKTMHTGMTSPFDGIGSWFHDRFTDIGNAFSGIGTFFHNLFTGAWNGITGVFGSIGKWFGARWTDVTTTLSPVTRWFGEVFQTSWNIITRIFYLLGKWFGDRWNDVVVALTPIANWFHDRFTDAWNKITAIFGAVGKWFGDRFTEVWNAIVTAFSPIVRWFSDRWNEVSGGVDTFTKAVGQKFSDLGTGVQGIIHTMINAIVDQLNNGISAVEGFINFFGQGLDNIAKALGTTGTIEVVHLGRIPHYADGTDAHPGGPAVVGERGRELVMLPRGASVLPHDATEQLLASGMIPGYAGGVGNVLGDITSWIAGGAKSVLDGMMQKMHINLTLPGKLESLATGAMDDMKKWALAWIQKILPAIVPGGGGSAGEGHAVNVSGNLAAWIQTAMGLTGAPGNWLSALETIAMAESGGNPNAINLTDSNAAAGHPSQGIMQTIPGTFAAYMLPGHGNILNPVDNIVAGIRYIMSRYGSVFNVPGIKSVNAGGGYVGYADGTDSAAGGLSVVGERGPELMNVPRGAQIIPNNKLGQVGAWGATLAQMFADGLVGATGAVGDAAQTVIQEVADYMGFASPAKKGPGASANLWGPNLVKQFANDIKSNSASARNAAEGMMQGVLGAITSTQNGINLAIVEGNKKLATSLRVNLTDLNAQSKLYQAAIKAAGDTYTAKTGVITFKNGVPAANLPGNAHANAAFSKDLSASHNDAQNMFTALMTSIYNDNVGIIKANLSHNTKLAATMKKQKDTASVQLSAFESILKSAGDTFDAHNYRSPITWKPATATTGSTSSSSGGGSSSGGSGMVDMTPALNNLAAVIGKLTAAVDSLIVSNKTWLGNLANIMEKVYTNIGFLNGNISKMLKIKGYASGTTSAEGGISWVGEGGPELMYVPHGASITPYSQLGASGRMQIIVMPAPVTMDGRVLANGLMPHITNAIKYNVGTHR